MCNNVSSPGFPDSVGVFLEPMLLERGVESGYVTLAECSDMESYVKECESYRKESPAMRQLIASMTRLLLCLVLGRDIGG